MLDVARHTSNQHRPGLLGKLFKIEASMYYRVACREEVYCGLRRIDARDRFPTSKC